MDVPLGAKKQQKESCSETRKRACLRASAESRLLFHKPSVRSTAHNFFTSNFFTRFGCVKGLFLFCFMVWLVTGQLSGFLGQTFVVLLIHLTYFKQLSHNENSQGKRYILFSLTLFSPKKKIKRELITNNTIFTRQLIVNLFTSIEQSVIHYWKNADILYAVSVFVDDFRLKTTSRMCQVNTEKKRTILLSYVTDCNKSTWTC